MKWTDLPSSLQEDIANNFLGYSDGLTENDIVSLNLLSPERLFECYCTWHGLIGWSYRLISVWETIKK